jgi:hypothetical protein
MCQNSWVHGLADLLREQKLDIKANDRFENKDHWQPIAGQSHLAGLEEYISRQPGRGLEQSYLEELAKELAGGAFADVAYIWVVGRKPA